jgi:uncharacterized 2Fe-2S/4Fe-4S cluster protein (DUF4445 family)
MSSVACGAETRPAVAGRSLFDYADEVALLVPSSCGRTGRCHECIVEVTAGAGALSPRTAAEGFLRDGFRLACQARLAGDDTPVRFAPLRRRPQILTDHAADDAAGPLDPRVRRDGGRVLIDGEEVDSFHGHILGMAVDLGTTTIAVELLDLETGAGLARAAFENPQRFGGSDVMSRIAFDAGPGRGELQKALIGALNAEIGALAARIGARRREIYEIVIAGNATMRDLCFGLDVQSIGQKPYKSLTERAFRAGERATTGIDVRAASLGLRANVRSRAVGLPLLASHVGGDVAADLLALGFLDPDPRPRMLLDIGTNTEVVIAAGGRIACCSCPAGPAFEGGGVEYGMSGRDGAIERVEVGPDGRATSWKVIGGGAPEGICGSGLVDLLAGLRRSGVMGPKGTFDRIGRKEKLLLLPAHGLTLSRADVSHLAQAKAANWCGQFILLRHCGLDPGDIAELHVAGGFANWLDVGNAVEIGFLAPVPAGRVRKAGNASLRGARRALLSMTDRRRLDALASQVEHVELETTPDFFEIFVEGCQFNPMPARIGGTRPVLHEGSAA